MSALLPRSQPLAPGEKTVRSLLRPTEPGCGGGSAAAGLGLGLGPCRGRGRAVLGNSSAADRDVLGPGRSALHPCAPRSRRASVYRPGVGAPARTALTSAVHLAQVGEAPHVAQAHGVRDAGEDELQRVGPQRTRLLHGRELGAARGCFGAPQPGRPARSAWGWPPRASAAAAHSLFNC